jgi:hypothetical protein
MEREYYSSRSGLVNSRPLDLFQLRKFFLSQYNDFANRNYFCEYFGYYCIDDDHVYGRFGSEESIQYKVFMKLGIDLWPFHFSLV